MQQTELQNAKDGAMELMRTFNASIHRVALAVTPPVHPANLCDTIENWTDASTWLPVPLSSDYQTSPGVLNTNSALVKETQCLDLAGSGDVPGPHTDLAEPLRAAMNELTTNGRATAKQNCTKDTPASSWYNKPANQLLLQMATDASHFYNQPKTADLDPVFQAIGNQLAAGSKLVQ